MPTTHTPGPWYADKLQDRNAYNIFAPGHCTALVTIEPGKYDGASPLCKNVHADAALIAAAPDLLSALRACVRAYDESVPVDQRWTTGTNLVPDWYAAARGYRSRHRADRRSIYGRPRPVRKVRPVMREKLADIALACAIGAGLAWSLVEWWGAP